MSASFVSPSVRMDGIASTRSRLSKAGHAPGAIYCSEDIFQREIATCFMKDWLCVGRVEEVAKPGDYMTMRIAGEPVVITRASDNNLHALYNMCAHRGVEVAHGRGNARVFNCPYHGWTYDLEGKLKGAAYMKESEGFDLSACRLQPIRIDVWRGSIFICFSAETEPFEEFIRPFEDDFAFLHPERCRIGYKLHLEVNCNWKFITENIMDFYHVKVLHAETFGARFSWKEEDVILKEHGGYTLFYKAGPHTPGAEPLLGKMPWLADQDLDFACTGFMRPNCTFFGRIDSVQMVVAWPVAPDRCEADVFRLFPHEFFERPDIDDTLEIYRNYSKQVLEEDRSMMESMQNAMSSPAYVPGRMSTQEKKLHHFLNAYLDRILDGDLPAGSAK